MLNIDFWATRYIYTYLIENIFRLYYYVGIFVLIKKVHDNKEIFNLNQGYSRRIYIEVEDKAMKTKNIHYNIGN